MKGTIKFITYILLLEVESIDSEKFIDLKTFEGEKIL